MGDVSRGPAVYIIQDGLSVHRTPEVLRSSRKPGDAGPHRHQYKLDRPRGISGPLPSRQGGGGRRLPELGRGQRGLPARRGDNLWWEPAGRDAIPGRLQWAKETPRSAVTMALDANQALAVQLPRGPLRREGTYTPPTNGTPAGIWPRANPRHVHQLKRL